MNDQNLCEDSYLSLSAFLCLDPKSNIQRTNQSQNEIKFLQNDKSVSFPINNCESSSRSDQQSKEQQSGENSKYGKQKRQKKEYSKNYRRRHKEYVESIEKMNTKYQRRIQQLTLKVDQLTEEIRCLKYGRQISDNLFDSPFTKAKEQTLKELVNQSQKENQTSWDKVKQFAQIYGFAGKQKINLLNYYMSEIMDNLLIDHHKNFVLNGLEDFEITKPYAQALYQKEMELVGSTSSDFTLLKKYLKKWMPQTLKKFHKIGQNFYQNYVNLINQAKEIQNHFTSIEDGVYKMLPADKYVGVLRWYEQSKHCKEIQILRKQWIESFRKK